MLKATELLTELKTIEIHINSHTNPDGGCGFDAEQVYILLKTASSIIVKSDDSEEKRHS